MDSSANKISQHLLKCCTALRFLTIIPVAWRAEEDGDYFNSCLWYFPVIGLLIGCCGALAAFGLQKIFPVSIVAAFSIVYLAFISGCLHLDGLSDSADGLFSARPRKRSLEIMKDSRVGAMGVVVVVCVLLTKFAALSSMNGDTLCLAVFFMPLVGRSSILFNMAFQKYAREEGGIGSLFYSDHSKAAAFIAFILLAVLLLIFAPTYMFFLIASVLITLYLFAAFCRAKIGGATGDTLGALCELTEMVTAISFTVSFSIY